MALTAGTDPHKVPIDPSGNLTAKAEGTDTWAYSWNAENQLTKVEKNGAEVARFADDPMGRRVDKVAGGATTSYTYDGDGILREVRGGGRAIEARDVPRGRARSDQPRIWSRLVRSERMSGGWSWPSRLRTRRFLLPA